MMSSTPVLPITKMDAEGQIDNRSRAESASGSVAAVATVDAVVGRALSRKGNGCARLLISDDAPVFRDGLRNLIESQPELSVAGESAGETKSLPSRTN
jgi:hypothetical protein